MGFIFAVGLVFGLLDAASILDIPNWVNWLTMGIPTAFVAGILALGVWAASK